VDAVDVTLAASDGQLATANILGEPARNVIGYCTGDELPQALLREASLRSQRLLDASSRLALGAAVLHVYIDTQGQAELGFQIKILGCV
jgi:hypothetical protein